jgi:hypothetical protein
MRAHFIPKRRTDRDGCFAERPFARSNLTPHCDLLRTLASGAAKKDSSRIADCGLEMNPDRQVWTGENQK